jgi:hypothetical protein
MKSTFETIWLFVHRSVGLVELLILYARVQFYTPRASDYRLISKTVSDNVDFFTPIFMPCFDSHFENGRHLENFENAELLL